MSTNPSIYPSGQTNTGEVTWFRSLGLRRLAVAGSLAVSLAAIAAPQIPAARDYAPEVIVRASDNVVSLAGFAALMPDIVLGNVPPLVGEYK